MVIVDTREPDTTIGNIRQQGKLPADEKVVSHVLSAGDVLISRLNVTIPENLAQCVEVMVKLGSVMPPIEEVITDPKTSFIASIAKKSIVIERKTPRDFLSSLSDGRLFDQGHRLLGFTDLPIFVVTGYFRPDDDGLVITRGYKTQWKWSSVEMSLLQLQLMGCAVLHVPSDAFPELVCLLWRWLFQHEHYVRKPRPVSLIPLSDAAEFLCGLPGIGPDKSQEVLGYTGNVKGALHFLTSTCSARLPNRPQGIGLQTIKRVRGFFDLAPDEVMLPTVSPDANDNNEEGSDGE